jgi:hypothetical protein
MNKMFVVEPHKGTYETCADCFNDDNEHAEAKWLVTDRYASSIWVCPGHLMSRLGFYLNPPSGQ